MISNIGFGSDNSAGGGGGNPSSGKKVLGIFLAAILLIGGGVTLANIFPTATNQGYYPEQPIPFSHKLHAGDNKIDCKYCHSSVERSRHASIPSLNVCMNCHSVVKTDSPHIKFIKEHYDKGQPIEWVRIHELPDFVYFTHKRHVAKGVACETCHGDVKTMERVEQVQPLTMGWCIDCHRGQTTPKNVLAQVYPGEKNPHGHVASVNCSTCHH